MKNKYKYKRSMINFVRNGILLLLTFIVFITAVVAWFIRNNKVDATGMNVNISNSQITVTEDPSGTIEVSEQFSLPCATKISDPDIDATDLSYALYVKVLYVHCTSEQTADIAVSVTEKSSDLHYYIDALHDSSDTLQNYASTIYNNPSLRDAGAVIAHEDGKTCYEIAVVFYADYDDQTPQRENDYSVTLNFS